MFISIIYLEERKWLQLISLQFKMEEPGKPVDEEEDDEVQLSISTLAALNEFLSEKNEREEKLKAIAESTASNKNLLDEIDLEEDWVGDHT